MVQILDASGSNLMDFFMVERVKKNNFKQTSTSNYTHVETILKATQDLNNIDNQIQHNINQVIELGTITYNHQVATSGKTSKTLLALTKIIKGGKAQNLLASKQQRNLSVSCYVESIQQAMQDSTTTSEETEKEQLTTMLGKD